ncbi:hypothetical protein ABEB36_002261 [Hypothenemus hampei]|uniref:Ubiquitin carboxyl-terminal hydrolase n=1 Tax=Hypothenemus hampei TaxID=57062 RepID=A0ABD1F582_HYPHA
MSENPCTHLSDSLTDYQEILFHLSLKQATCCTDCDYRGPNLWLCLNKGCGHIGCPEISNDHSTLHHDKNSLHCLHMNLSTRRVWCYQCKAEVYLDQCKRQSYNKEYESDQESVSSGKFYKDSGHGSYATLRANSPDRGTIFENSVGLNVMMNDGEASDISDSGDYGDTCNNMIVRRGGLVGMQNIGNTCYMNSALQALSNTEPLTRYFLECANIVHILSEGKKPGLSKTYQALIRDIWIKKNNQGFVTPSGILYGIRNVHPMFRGYHQHDTQEFLRNFMDQLHEELKQPLAPEMCNINDTDMFSMAMDDIQNTSLNYDSSEGEYETCDSGVSERSSLSEDSEQMTESGQISLPITSKRRLSRCQSPNRRQRPRVASQNIVIDQQPSQTPKKPIKYRSIISDIFDGKLLSSVQCLTCNRISSGVETFQDLSLPIPSKDHLVLLHGRPASPNVSCSDVLVPVQDGWISWILAWLRSWWYGPVVTLHDCLSAFFSTDELKGDNMYSCEKCNKLRNGIKFSKVLQLPEVLCIHLKRFRHELMYSSKISSAVSFPLKGLDMWPYLLANNTSKVSNYELFSVICHHGTAGGGHYTSYALNKGQWYEFDDQYVSKVPPERVQNCEAYVLFYRKVQKSADIIRQEAARLKDDAEQREDVKRVPIARQWLTKFNYCVEPGPIDNSDFLCQHGSLDPDSEDVFDQLFVQISLEMYEYLFKQFGGCPPMTKLVICPACAALQKRILREMTAFVEITRKTQSEQWPHTHYISGSWYLQWHAFVSKKISEPPGPIDNSKIDPANINLDEAMDVPQPIWEFFYNIYGGGPTIAVPVSSEEETEYSREEIECEMEGVKGNEMGDAPILREPENLFNGFTDGQGNKIENDYAPVQSELPSSEIEQNNNENLPPKTEFQQEVATSPIVKPKTSKKGGRSRRRNH